MRCRKMEEIRLQYIIEGNLDDNKRTPIGNGLESSYDLEEFRKNPMEIHKQGTKGALKSIVMYYMCNLAEVQRVVVKTENERYIDITVPMLQYIQDNDLLLMDNLL